MRKQRLRQNGSDTNEPVDIDHRTTHLNLCCVASRSVPDITTLQLRFWRAQPRFSAADAKNGEGLVDKHPTQRTAHDHQQLRIHTPKTPSVFRRLSQSFPATSGSGTHAGPPPHTTGQKATTTTMDGNNVPRKMSSFPFFSSVNLSTIKTPR